MRSRIVLTLLLISTTLAAAARQKGDAPAPVAPLPGKSQVAWQQLETYAFVHFGLNTFNGTEWGFGNVDPATFNPSQLDCEQWVRTFKQAGMKAVILTAKHHDGFCLWPTQYTDYSVRRSPWKNGGGDVVGELAAACRKYGLKFGFYLSPWDRHQASYGTAAYVEYYHDQLQELLTHYGPVFEVWLDGANGGDGYYGGAVERRNIDRRTYYDFPRIHQTVFSAQPDAIIFSDGGPGCRWTGNEKGTAGTTNWAFLRDGVYAGYPYCDELNVGHADGTHWAASECDVSIRPGWFFHPEEDSLVKSPATLLDLYYKSVGHNATLLLNFPVDRTGRVNAIDSANAVKFHEMVVSDFQNDLLRDARVKASSVRSARFSAKNVIDGDYDSYWATPDAAKSGWLEFTFRRPTAVNRLMIQEYIPLGQRVKSFVVEYFEGGKWLPVDAGEETTTIGYKRILRFPTVKTRKLRIRFTDARACLCINGVSAYCADSGA